ncbi:hypothetical protein V2G26_015146 [Clonostachys chloroleuca]
MDYFTPNHPQGQHPNQQAQQQNNNQGRIQMQPPSSMQIPVTAGSNMMDGQAMVNGNNLDDMVRENENAILRRRSMPQQPFGDDGVEVAPRRMSTAGTGDMLNFGGNDAIRNYQYNQQTTPLSALDTANLGLPDALPGSMSDYMADPSDYSNLSPDMMGSMIPSTFANMNMGPIPGESHNVNMFSGSMGGPYASGQLSGLRQDFSLDMNVDGQFMTPPNVTGGVMSESGDTLMPVSQSMNTMDHTNQQVNISLDPQLGDFGNNTGLSHNVSSTGSIISPEQGTSSTGITHPNSSSDMATSAIAAPVAPPGLRKNTYSKSGFDMMKALWLVSTRKDPKVHLGAVDLSCAFVVCDVTMNDCPIVYVSDNFQNLTGYSRHEIVGQNCRFLQAPNGKVQAGVKREFVDDKAVYNLKRTIQEGCEVQQSLINYRKGGKPFLNLLTMIPIPWDSTEIRYIIGFQIDLVECPDAITSNQERGGLKINYKHSDIGQYIWQPPSLAQMEHENGQTLGLDDVSTLLQQFNPSGLVSDWHKQSWDKMLLENTDDMIHVLSLKGLFLYLSPACKRILEYDPNELLGNALSTVCHPSDIVPVTRELKDAPPGGSVDIVYRIRRKNSGYTWFESHGSLVVEQGKGRKCIILVGRKRPVIALSRQDLEVHGGIGDSELWTKMSTSGMFLFVSSNIRSLLDLQPESLVGTSIQDLMRKESRTDFGYAIEKARRGKIVNCKHEVQNRRGQVLQAQTVLYPGDATEGQKPSFLLGQTKLMKASSRSIAPASSTGTARSGLITRSDPGYTPATPAASSAPIGHVSQPAGGCLMPGSQDAALASDDNMFDELRTTKCSSWQFELRQMEKVNRILAEELGGLLSSKKKRKRRKGAGNVVRDCANCHTRNTPEWRRGPSGQRDLCNSCGLRWAKQVGRVSSRHSARGSKETGESNSKKSPSPLQTSPLHKQMSAETPNPRAPDGDRTTGRSVPAISEQSTPSGASSAGSSMPLSTTMPPPSHSSLSGNTSGTAMTSIREERESNLQI